MRRVSNWFWLLLWIDGATGAAESLAGLDSLWLHAATGAVFAVAFLLMRAPLLRPK